MPTRPPGVSVLAGSTKLQPATRQKHDYLAGIDLVRFLAAVSVAAFHFTWDNHGAPWLMPFGWVGVEVFFVISGLVIANSASGATTRSFAVNRFLRLYPGAWCSAVISGAVLLLFSSKAYASIGIDAGLNLRALLDSLSLVVFPFLSSAYWTLPIELIFYLIVLLLIDDGRIGQMHKLAVALILWSSIYLAPTALNAFGLAHFRWFRFAYGAENLTLLRHGVYFALGILVYQLKEKRITATGIVAMTTGLLLAGVEIYSRAVELAPTLARSAGAARPDIAGLAIASCAAFYLAFFAIILAVRFNHQFPANKSLRDGLRVLGLATYPFYLLHESVGGATLLMSIALGVPFLACVVIALVVVGTVSVLVASIMEPGLRNWLRRFVSPGSVTPVVAEETANP